MTHKVIGFLIVGEARPTFSHHSPAQVGEASPIPGGPQQGGCWAFPRRGGSMSPGSQSIHTERTWDGKRTAFTPRRCGPCLPQGQHGAGGEACLQPACRPNTVGREDSESKLSPAPFRCLIICKVGTATLTSQAGARPLKVALCQHLANAGGQQLEAKVSGTDSERGKPTGCVKESTRPDFCPCTEAPRQPHGDAPVLLGRGLGLQGRVGSPAPIAGKGPVTLGGPGAGQGAVRDMPYLSHQEAGQNRGESWGHGRKTSI